MSGESVMHITTEPCPFCGREPEISTRAGGLNDGAAFLAFMFCHCGGYCARAHHFAGGDTPAEARSAVAVKWNTRATAPAGVLTAEKALQELAAYFEQARDLSQRRASRAPSAHMARDRDLERSTFEHARQMVESYREDLGKHEIEVHGAVGRAIEICGGQP